MNSLSFAASATITSLEISALVESRHDKVRQSIERLAERGAIQLPPLGIVEDKQSLSPNSKTKVYTFSGEQGKRDSIIVVAQLSPEFTARLVDRWQELEAQAARPAFALPDFTNPAEAAEAWAAEYRAKSIAQAEQQRLEAKIVADKPKVEFAEAVRKLDGSCLIREFAKVIGTGQNRLFQQLREDGFLMANNTPYQQFIERGWFVVIEGTPFTDSNGKSHPTFTTRITGKGQVGLARRYGKQNGVEV